MKWTIRMLMMAVLAVGVALCLLVLSRMDTASSVGNAWTDKQARQLNDRNLVDYMIELPLQLRIRKVDLNHSILSIDLNLPKNVDQATVYRDLYAIAQLTIAKTSNVNQVLVRIMDYSGASTGSASQLVLAMEADRQNANEMLAEPLSDIAKEQQLKTRFHLTYTSRWQQRYPL
ncbi:hypothetical protein D3C73_766350 [compost metagenome]